MEAPTASLIHAQPGTPVTLTTWPPAITAFNAVNHQPNPDSRQSAHVAIDSQDRHLTYPQIALRYGGMSSANKRSPPLTLQLADSVEQLQVRTSGFDCESQDRRFAPSIAQDWRIELIISPL